MRFFRLPFAFGGLGSRCLSSVGLFGLFERGACSQEPQSSCALHSCCRGFVASRAHGAGENLLDASFTAKLLETNEYFKGINLSQVKIGKLLPSIPMFLQRNLLIANLLTCLFSVLQPHLHKIVNSSMELAQTAKEPYNYFLLLRALFRSIGGGSHDLLYQEFLPLLPNLLQGQGSDFGCPLVLCTRLGLAALGVWGSSSAPGEGHGGGMYVCVCVCVCLSVCLSPTLRKGSASRKGWILLPSQS